MVEDGITQSKDYTQLARQLRCPQGEEGRQLGDVMFKSNNSMIQGAVAAMHLQDHQRILEIGPGNGGHLRDLLEPIDTLKYFGLEISETMREVASRTNQEYIDSNRALFRWYDGEEIPYVGQFFNTVFSVNTIYFWPRPEAFLNELFRVLKPGGCLVLAYANQTFMKTLPFVDETFELYDLKKMETLVATTEFEVHNLQIKNEEVESKSGEMLEREYTIVTLRKKLRL